MSHAPFRRALTFALTTAILVPLHAGLNGCATDDNVGTRADRPVLRPSTTYGTPDEDEAGTTVAPDTRTQRRQTPQQTPQQDQQQVPPPDASAAQVPQGHKVEVVMSGLDYPTSAAFDDAGNLYIAEAGYAYGDPTAKPRILRVSPRGNVEAAFSQNLSGPINDLLWHNGRLYISHRGRISVLNGQGTINDLVTDLPSKGDHQNNQLTVGEDGKIYFGQGTATNSGVVGMDNVKMGWVKDHPEFHDIPAKNLPIINRTYTTPNPLQPGEQQARTSAFHAFGEMAQEDKIVEGQVKASGTILRMNSDGEGLEVVAWGLRNPFGVMWSPDGSLYVTENGMDVRGSRPVANDQEDIYVIKEGAWYGWPDFAMGLPVTDPRFKPDDADQPQFVMTDHPPVEKPWTNFPRHAAISKLAFSTNEAFGNGMMYVAFFGHMSPMTGDAPDQHGGHRVAVIDPQTKEARTFLGRRGHHGDQAKQNVQQQGTQQQANAQQHAGNGHGEGMTAGPRRPIDVVFSPDGQALYVVDFGVMTVSSDGPRPRKGTGVVWRVLPNDAQAPQLPANLKAPAGN